MGDFKFLNYHTEYEVHGTSNKKMSVNACFAYVFGNGDFLDNQYKILIYKELHMAKKQRDNNCFLSKIELHHHITLLKKIYGFSFSIEEKINKDLVPYYELNMHVKGPNIMHRFILTWIRYVYEFPYNVYVTDIYKMKKDDTFKFVNVFTLFNIVATYNADGNSGHMLTSPGFEYKNMRCSWIKNKLVSMNKKHDNYVSNVFERIIDPNKHAWERDYDGNKIDTLKDWEKSYNDRLSEYIKIYNKIKKIK